MADPANLELLNRSSDAGGFEIVRVDSLRAYSAYKPSRLPQSEWEVTAQPKSADGTRQFVLRNLRHDSYILLDSREYFLWNYLDGDRKSTRLNSSHGYISYAVFCLKKKN